MAALASMQLQQRLEPRACGRSFGTSCGGLKKAGKAKECGGGLPAKRLGLALLMRRNCGDLGPLPLRQTLHKV